MNAKKIWQQSPPNLLGQENTSNPFMASGESYYDLRKSFKLAQVYADKIGKVGLVNIFPKGTKDWIGQKKKSQN